MHTYIEQSGLFNKKKSKKNIKKKDFDKTTQHRLE